MSGRSTRRSRGSLEGRSRGERRSERDVLLIIEMPVHDLEDGGLNLRIGSGAHAVSVDVIVGGIAKHTRSSGISRRSLKSSLSSSSLSSCRRLVTFGSNKLAVRRGSLEGLRSSSLKLAAVVGA